LSIATTAETIAGGLPAALDNLRLRQELSRGRGACLWCHRRTRRR